MDSIITQQEELAFAALVAGGIAILINTLPFFIKVMMDKSKATKDDDFNIFSSLFWLYVIQYVVSVSFCYLVEAYDVMNEAEQWVSLTGVDGAFHLFWNSDVDALMKNAMATGQSELAGTYFHIKWTREFFTIIISLLMITLPLLGYRGGYKHTYAMQQKTNSESEWLNRFAMGFAGLFAISILIAGYNFMTMESYFMGKSILSLVQNWYTKVFLI